MDKISKVVVISCLVALVVFATYGIWFSLTHTCVRSHQELVPLSCTSDVYGTLDCTPAHYEEVCDEWVRAR